MKKFLFCGAFLFVGLTLVAFSPSSTTSDYSDVKNAVKGDPSLKEVSSFTESQTSQTTADQVVWSKRHKVWTEIASQNTVTNIQSALSRN